MAQKPSIPKGTRDFGQLEMARRNYIFDTIRSVFGLYGFQQIETPAMENIGTLMGKYGEEGDKLLFRIQNSGEKAASAPEKGLRYDLTVPFARSPSNAFRYSLYGAPTDRRKAATASSINATWM